jgi:transposase
LNNQLDLFNPDVLAHAEADPLALCINTPKKARCMMQNRQIRGLEIASQPQPQITYNETFWTVPSQTSSKSYAVTIDPPFCTCPDFRKNAMECKHICAVKYTVARESGAILPEAPPQKKTYKQDWVSYTQAQVNEKAKVLELLFALCETIEDAPQHMGRPRISLADRIFATVFKVYECRSGRRFMSDLREALQRGYLSQMPHFNSISRYIESEELTPILKRLIIESSLPLKEIEWDFAVDSSGFSTGRCDRWVDTKWDKSARRYGTESRTINTKDWLKCHLMCGVKTNIVTGVEISGSHSNDSPYFTPLVETTSQNFVMQGVMADMAYSSNKNLKLVLVKGAQPYIPFKSNTTANDKRNNKRNSDVWRRMYHFFLYNQDRFMESYHKRSNVEATFSMIKRKFGERLRTRTTTAQINELLCKILCHNICVVIQSMYELGIVADFTVGAGV